MKDAKALRHLILQAEISNTDLLKYSFTVDYAFVSLDYDQLKVPNLPSIHSMISSKAVSKGMAEKIAGSGLNFRHLYIAFQRGTRNDLRVLLGEKRNGSVRVSEQTRVTEKLINFIEMFVNTRST